MRDVHKEDYLFDNKDSNKNDPRTITVAMFLEEFNTWREWHFMIVAAQLDCVHVKGLALPRPATMSLDNPSFWPGRSSVTAPTIHNQTHSDSLVSGMDVNLGSNFFSMQDATKSGFKDPNPTLPTHPYLMSRTDGSSTFPSPVLSGSPDLHSTALLPTDAGQCDLEQLAKDDPLATQVWKMYARTKANFQHSQRMENLTWRMMALALKKKKDDETEEGGQAEVQMKGEPAEVEDGPVSPTIEVNKHAEVGDKRGRRIDKGKMKVSVVGSHGTNQDHSTEDDE